MNHSRRILDLTLAIIDMVCFIISYFLGGYIWLVGYRGVSVINMQTELLSSFGIVMIAYLLVLVFSNIESNFIGRSGYRDLFAAVESSVIILLVTVLVIFLQHNNADASRGVYFVIAAINLALFFISHVFVRYYLLTVYKNKKSANQVFLVTTSDRVQHILKEAARNNDWSRRLTCIAIIDEDQTGKEYNGIPVVATYDSMYDYAKGQIVDEVFVNVPYEGGANIANVVDVFEEMGATVHVTIEMVNQFKDYHMGFNMMGNTPVVTFSNRIYSWKMLFLKRIMDILGGIVGTIIMLIAMIFVAPPLLIESPGPLFFSQKRVGKNGRYFKIYKFRSMYMDAEERKKELMAQNEMDGLMFKMKDDPRITKVGKFIRKTSIDELPQFINVLKGDMSLVGTRPPTVDEFKQYESHQKRRLAMKPGITGLWQVSGRNKITDFEEVVKLDTQYIDNWSLGYDIKILFKTIKVVITRDGE